MANKIKSSPKCNKCKDLGYIDTYHPFTACWGDVFLCQCNCIPLNQLESEAIARLRSTNKVKPYEYNTNLNLLLAIKRKKL